MPPSRQTWLKHRYVDMQPPSMEIMPVRHENRSVLARASFERRSSVLTTGDSPLKHTYARFVGVAMEGDHCTYVIIVDTGLEEVGLWKRYSEFRRFRQELCSAVEMDRHCGKGPCKYVGDVMKLSFPKRRWHLRKDPNMALARKRSHQLQDFCSNLLELYRNATRRQVRCCVNDGCPVFQAIASFLQLSISVIDDTALEVEAPLDASRRIQSHDLPPRTRVASMTVSEGTCPEELMYPIHEDTEIHHLLTH